MVAGTVKPQVIGHRGASASEPENTIDAFRLAVVQGAHGVELDVRRAADGVSVVHHDANLLDGRLIAATPSGEMPPSVPTLATVLAAGPWFVNIEIKNDRDGPDHDPGQRLVSAVLADIAAHGAAGRVLISSFDWATVRRVRELAPALAVAWLVWTGTPGDAGAWVARAAEAGMQGINPEDVLVDEALVAAAHERGLAVSVWTVDDPDRIRALARLGVDAVITNDPALALAALAAMPTPTPSPSPSPGL